MKWLVSWALYWAGDLAYRLDLGRAYQRLMQWASDVQGDGPGPWENVK